jgi:hypothetical protein
MPYGTAHLCSAPSAETMPPHQVRGSLTMRGQEKRWGLQGAMLPGRGMISRLGFVEMALPEFLGSCWTAHSAEAVLGKGNQGYR